MRTLIIKTAGVTHDGRQAVIWDQQVGGAVRLEPEPNNKFDPNAIKVMVGYRGKPTCAGYVPKELASELAPLMDGESLMGVIDSIPGGGKDSYVGLWIKVEIPEPNDSDLLIDGREIN